MLKERSFPSMTGGGCWPIIFIDENTLEGYTHGDDMMTWLKT